MEKDQYNFYLIGQKRAQDFSDEIRRYTDEIGKNYGPSAKRDFLLGVASKMPVYSEDYNDLETKDRGIKGK